MGKRRKRIEFDGKITGDMIDGFDLEFRDKLQPIRLCITTGKHPFLAQEKVRVIIESI